MKRKLQIAFWTLTGFASFAAALWASVKGETLLIVVFGISTVVAIFLIPPSEDFPMFSDEPLPPRGEEKE